MGGSLVDQVGMRNVTQYTQDLAVVHFVDNQDESGTVLEPPVETNLET